MANRVDGWCACIIPPSYFTLLILLVNADLRDAYIRPPTDPTKVVSTGVVDNEMFSGIHSVGPMSGGRFFVTILIPLIVVLMLIGSCVAVMCARSAQILPASEVEVRRRQRTRRIATTDSSRYERRRRLRTNRGFDCERRAILFEAKGGAGSVIREFGKL